MTFLNSLDGWRVITHLGSASLLLPIFALHFGYLWLVQKTAAYRWLLALGVAVLLTLASKCLFWGWGIGVAALDFTGVSGHALLASAIFPVLFCIHLPRGSLFKRRLALVLGLLLSLLIGCSRVVLAAHSVSEVVLASLLGFAVSAYVLSAMDGFDAQDALGNLGNTKPQRHQRSTRRLPWLVRLSPLFFLFAFNSFAAQILPSHTWEIKLALAISGRDQPFRR